jgi:hypothetical protein
VVLAGCFVLLCPAMAFGQTATTAGAVTVPYPTTQSISIEWAITGDTNNNAGVTRPGISVRATDAGATSSPAVFSTCRQGRPTRSS